MDADMVSGGSIWQVTLVAFGCVKPLAMVADSLKVDAPKSFTPACILQPILLGMCRYNDYTMVDVFTFGMPHLPIKAAVFSPLTLPWSHI